MSENRDATKRIYTTGEAAKICKVSQQTIIRCFDNGRLAGFKVPGSKFRRIPRDELVRFMRENGMSLAQLGERLRVLVIDDDPASLTLAKAGLEREGRYEVSTASSAFDAGFVTATFKPDLIVVEFMLPDLDGVAVSQRLRSEEATRGVKILCMSASMDARAVDELRRAGVDAFLQKPFQAGTLAERVGVMLGVG